MDLEKVAADGKRIAEKLRETEQLAKQSKLENKSPSTTLDINPKKGQVMFRWREDEDDRYTAPERIWNKYQEDNPPVKNPEIMLAALKALFLADHDARQLEQYELENKPPRQEDVQKAANHLSAFVNTGLRVLFTFILIVGAGSGRLKAQEVKASQALKIGDQMPDITIQNIINYPSTTAKISDFKGKLLILDFWASWCSPCVTMIPKADSLQKAFAGKLAFLQITHQSEKEILPFLKRMKSSWDLEVTTAVNNRQLDKLFPHRNLPHYVWIDETGVVKAMTGYEEITAGNIRKHLEGQQLSLRIKKEKTTPYDADKPFLVGNNGGDGSNLLYHSVLTSYTDGIPGGWTFSKPGIGDPRRIALTNLTLLWLYRLAYGEEKQHFGKNKVILEVKDPSKFTSTLSGRKYEDWMRAGNGYCYELQVPAALNEQSFKIMQDDLRRFFYQYKASVEKRKTNCLLLVRTSQEDKLRSTGGSPVARFDAFGCNLKNQDLVAFTDRLGIFYLQKHPLPLLNETGYDGKVDLTITARLSDVQAINAELAKYDLKIIEGEREIDMLVISDKE